MSYKIRKVVSAEDVPNWERRPPKWDELVEEVLSLEPGQSLEVEFDDYATADRARNAVRDTANLRAQTVIVTTRVIKQEDESALLYLTRLYTDEDRKDE